MKERILEIMQKNSLTAWKFAEILKVQPSSISHILSGRNKPSFDFIEKVLLCFPEISSDWLVLGNGDMYRLPNNIEDVTENDPMLEPEEHKEPENTSHSLFDNVDEEKNESAASHNNGNVTNVNQGNSEEFQAKDPIGITNVIASDNEKKEFSEPPIPLFDKDIDKIVVFYKDRRFRTYYPE